MIIVRKAQPAGESDEAPIVLGVLGKLTWGDARSLDGHDGWSLVTARALASGDYVGHKGYVEYGKNVAGKDVLLHAQINGTVVEVTVGGILRFAEPAFAEALEERMKGAHSKVVLKPAINREGFVGVVRPIMIRVDAALGDAKDAINDRVAMEQWESILRGGE